MESWRESRVIIKHLNTHHKEKLLMGECRYNLMLALIRESRKWQACNLDFTRKVMEMQSRLRAAECCGSHYLIRNCKHIFKQRKNSHFSCSMFTDILEKWRDRRELSSLFQEGLSEMWSRVRIWGRESKESCPARCLHPSEPLVLVLPEMISSVKRIQRGRTKLSSNCHVLGTETQHITIRKEVMKWMLKGLQFWWEKRCKSLMMKHQVEAMVSGHGSVSSWRFPGREVTALWRQCQESEWDRPI